MGSCFSSPPQPTVRPQLFPDVYPDKDTQPAVYVLRPPEPQQRPGTRKVQGPPRPSVDAAVKLDAMRYSSDHNQQSSRTRTLKRAHTPISTYPYNVSNVQPVDLESGRDAGAQAEANLAHAQAKAAATAAAQASAAAHAMSLQMGIISLQSPGTTQHNRDEELKKKDSLEKKKSVSTTCQGQQSEQQDSSVRSLDGLGLSQPLRRRRGDGGAQVELTSSVSGASADSCGLETERELVGGCAIEEELEVEYFGDRISA